MSTRSIRFLWLSCVTFGLAAGLAASATRAEEPMSAIDWLSRSVAAPAAVPPTAWPGAEAPPSQGAAAGGAGVQGPAGAPPLAGPQSPAISVTVLGAQSNNALGLLPSKVTGLPRDLWGTTPEADIERLIRARHADSLPALQDLLYTLLLAEADPPRGTDGKGGLLLARIDRLLDLGALDQAQALLELSGVETPQLFRRYFDVALLLGDEDVACQRMQETPEVAPTFPARIFCLARAGDWNAASLTLKTAEALNFVTPEQSALLERFLDPELADGADPLPAPSRPSPLVWRMMEAIGQPMPTNTLPLAFAQGDLRSNTGWKARIGAAERLTRSGALPTNKLLGLYTENRPAASGGVWTRVAAVQAFDAALTAKDMAAVARTLPPVWDAMRSAELEVPFASLFADKLAGLPLTGTSARTAFHIGLLSKDYEAIANAYSPTETTDLFLRALARGRITGLTPPDATARAIAAAFANPAPVPPDLAALTASHQLGEALLLAIDRVNDGAAGDMRAVTEGLALLRSVGLEDVARRTGLQLMLLQRRG